MICNKTESGWDIIYQRAHALLAAALIEQWRIDQRPSRWIETLAATAQHDNGWQEWEASNQLTPLGTPRALGEGSLEDAVPQLDHAIARARHQSLWSGWLVSRHAQQLFEPQRGQLQALDNLLDAQAELRQRWRTQLEVDEKALERAYALLLFGDTFSLILCRGEIPFGGRALEIEAGPDGTRHDVRQLDGAQDVNASGSGALTVEPWPYAVDEFTVSVDVYPLHRLTFADDDDLAQALQGAAVQPRSWSIRRA